MVLRRFHYDLAFEHYLRQNGIPYVAVDEAKRALSGRYASGQAPAKLKSFDFVVYSEAGANLLVDVKGRKLSVRRGRAANRARTMAGNGAGNGAGGNGAGDGRTGFGGDSGNVSGGNSGGRGRIASGGGFQNWVTADDVSDLKAWQKIFGPGFEATFAFLFWCDAQPPDALYHEVFAFGERWYVLLAIRLTDYEPHIRQRSAKWDTVSIPAQAFQQAAQPLNSLLEGTVATIGASKTLFDPTAIKGTPHAPQLNLAG